MTPPRPCPKDDNEPDLAFSAANLLAVVWEIVRAGTQRPRPPSMEVLMNETDRPTLSVAETAELLGISRWLVQQAVRDGSLPSVRVGRRILIPTERLRLWLSGAAAPEPQAPAQALRPLPPRPAGRADHQAS